MELSTWGRHLDSEILDLIELSHCMTVYQGCDVIIYMNVTVRRAEIRESPCFFCTENSTHHLTILHRDHALR